MQLSPHSFPSPLVSGGELSFRGMGSYTVLREEVDSGFCPCCIFLRSLSFSVFVVLMISCPVCEDHTLLLLLVPTPGCVGTVTCAQSLSCLFRAHRSLLLRVLWGCLEGRLTRTFPQPLLGCSSGVMLDMKLLHETWILWAAPWEPGNGLFGSGDPVRLSGISLSPSVQGFGSMEGHFFGT